MGLCVLYYVEYSLYNVKKVGLFYLGWNYTLSIFIMSSANGFNCDQCKNLLYGRVKPLHYNFLSCCSGWLWKNIACSHSNKK